MGLFGIFEINFWLNLVFVSSFKLKSRFIPILPIVIFLINFQPKFRLGWFSKSDNIRLFGWKSCSISSYWNSCMLSKLYRRWAFDSAYHALSSNEWLWNNIIKFLSNTTFLLFKLFLVIMSLIQRLFVLMRASRSTTCAFRRFLRLSLCVAHKEILQALSRLLLISSEIFGTFLDDYRGSETCWCGHCLVQLIRI